MAGFGRAKRSNEGRGAPKRPGWNHQEGYAMSTSSFGQTIEGLSIAGHSVRAGVFDEHQVRAAAGLTLVAGAVAFVYAYFAKSVRAHRARDRHCSSSNSSCASRWV